ncbi:MAG: hypothetical protein M3Q14_01055 [bacterium]|nr:hypothetical protein [bacterium]
MPAYKKHTSFGSDDEKEDIKNLLELMVVNETYNTQSSFSANSERFPDNQISFIEKHMDYLMCHKGLNPYQYVSNLRLMTRIR